MVINVIKSKGLLLRSSFRIVYDDVDKEVRPELCGKKFLDLFSPFIDGLPISNLEMFSHQCRAADALLFRRNVILTAGTGSGGKTEAWAIPAMVYGFKTLVIYPNKALSNDQVRRLSEYARGLGKGVGEVHADTSNFAGDEDIVVTNPAYLMTTIKRGRGKLIRFLSKLDLIVIDEFAFYSLAQQQMLLELLRVISSKYSRPIITVLTATLRGIKDLGSELTSINGKETEVIEGAPSRRMNITYVVEGGDLINYLVDLMRSGEDAATIVFVETINTAEKISRKVKARCADCPIATHHSKLSRDRRARVEDGLRMGDIKVVVSPRTLEQGIDIGLVARVVHYGLPREPMIFIQREGRKGRKLDIPFTETVIMLVKDMDRAIISEGLREWVDIGPSGYMRVRENRYIEMFRSLYNAFRNGDDNELSTLGLSRKKARTIWTNMQFYSYGITNYVVYVDGTPLDMQVSQRDFIEYYQPGNIDLVTSSVVLPSVENRIIEVNVKRIIALTNEYPWLRNSLIKYMRIKYKLGEKPDLEGDIEEGRLEGKVLVNALVPPNGFGILKEWPEEVAWLLEPRNKVREDEVIKMSIDGAPVQGSYKYYTYGYEVPLSSDKAEVNFAALTMFMAAVRLTHRINAQHLMGFATTDIVKIWEREPAGVLQSLNYEEIMSYLLTTIHNDKKLRLAIAIIDKDVYIMIKNSEKFYAIRDKALELTKELRYIVKT